MMLFYSKINLDIFLKGGNQIKAYLKREDLDFAPNDQSLQGTITMVELFFLGTIPSHLFSIYSRRYCFLIIVK